MRIIGGKAKGRIFQFDLSSKERPTSDFLREALFNVLSNIEGKSFLDLYAGSGSVGLEAASRGAREVCFMEADRKLAALIKRNITLCGFQDVCFMMMTNIATGLKNLYRRGYETDIVFFDPPYNKGLVQETLDLLQKYKIMKEETKVVIQHSVREKFIVQKGTFGLCDERKYGDTVLTFLKWRENNGRKFH